MYQTVIFLLFMSVNLFRIKQSQIYWNDTYNFYKYRISNQFLVINWPHLGYNYTIVVYMKLQILAKLTVNNTILKTNPRNFGEIFGACSSPRLQTDSLSAAWAMEKHQRKALTLKRKSVCVSYIEHTHNITSH